MLERESKVLGLAEFQGSEENHMRTTMCFLGMDFWFQFLPSLAGYDGAPNKLQDEGKQHGLFRQKRISSKSCLARLSGMIAFNHVGIPCLPGACLRGSRMHLL